MLELNKRQKGSSLGKRRHTMATKRYQAIEVRQQPGSRAMYMICASARELLEWCDVPRTKEDYMAGYQRVLTERRVEEISGYLSQSPNNILPGAVIVAADIEYVSVANDGSNVFIDVRDDTRDYKTKLEELFGAFTTRLSNEELASADINFRSSDDTLARLTIRGNRPRAAPVSHFLGGPSRSGPS
jgi:hypothetical protein